MSIDKNGSTGRVEGNSSVGNAASQDPAKEIKTAQDLVDAFKKSGRFEAERTAILKQFMRSRDGDDFQDRIEEFIDDKLYDLHPASARSSSSAKTKQEAIDQVYRELQGHRTFRRAEEDMDETILWKRTKEIELDLEDIVRDSRRPSVKREEQYRDVEMEWK